MVYDWPIVDWITTCNYRNIQFQGYVIHRSLQTAMFKIIHTLAQRLHLVVHSICFVLYDCLYSIPIGAHNLPTRSLWEFGPFFFGKRLKLGQAGWFPGHHSGDSSPAINFQWYSGQDAEYCHSRMLISFSLNDFWTTLAVRCGSLPCGASNSRRVRAYQHIHSCVHQGSGCGSPFLMIFWILTGFPVPW